MMFPVFYVLGVSIVFELVKAMHIYTTTIYIYYIDIHIYIYTYIYMHI